jgi:hypothetical protein
MFLVVHGSVGALLGIAAPHPLAAFVLGVASHYVLDVVPHGDDALFIDHDPQTRTRKLMLAGLIDAALLGAVGAVLMMSGALSLTWSILAGVVGGVLPDALQAVTILRPNFPGMQTLQRMHDYFHSNLIRARGSTTGGMLRQAATLVVAIILLV